MPVVLALPLLLGPGVLACLKGGYFDGPRLGAAIAAWSLLAVAAVALPRERLAGLSAPAPLALGGLAALTALTGASIAWAPDGGAAADDLQRLLLYLPYLAAAIAVLGDPRARRLTEPLLLLGIVAACLYALADRLSILNLEQVVVAGDRLAYPLTYWNASGAFAAIGLILAAALSGDHDRPPALRSAAAAAGPPLALVVLLAFSRGALGALAVGVMLLLALAPTRPRLAGAALVVLGGGAAAAILALAVPGLRTADGTSTVAGLAGLVGLAAAMAACAAGARGVSAEPAGLPIPRLRSAALAACALALAGTIAAILSTERHAGGDQPQASPQRLASIQSNRYDYWKAAVDAFAGHPLGGEGSGSFRVIWLRERPFLESVRDGHSLYLETAAELGLGGLLALALLIGGTTLAAIRAGPQAAGAVAALAAFALHAGVDWDWELPALALVALALAARLIAAAPTRRPAAAPGGRAR
jgi:hypothetical protein